MTARTCPPCHGHCRQGRACPARESASRAFALPRAASRRLGFALMAASACAVAALVALPFLF